MGLAWAVDPGPDSPEPGAGAGAGAGASFSRCRMRAFIWGEGGGAWRGWLGSSGAALSARAGWARAARAGAGEACGLAGPL